MIERKHFKRAYKPTALHGNEDPSALGPPPLQFKDKKFLIRNISSRVERGLQAYEDNLNSRRRMLKKFLDDEENEFMEEIKKNQDDIKKLKLAEKKAKSEALNKADIKKNRNILAKKQLQLDIGKCMEIRELLCKRRDIETKQIQKLQIKEKEDILNQEKQIDLIWFQVMKSDSEAKEGNDLCEIEKRIKKKSETKLFLDAQISMSQEEKRRKILEEREIENHIVEKNKIQSAKEITECSINITKKKVALGEDLKNQIRLQQETIERTRQQEWALDNTLMAISKAKQEAEVIKQLANKEQIKRELEKFGQHVWTMRADRMAREQEEEHLLAELARQNTNVEINHRCELNMQRKKKIQEAKVGRDLQLEAKKQESQQTIQQAIIDAELRIQLQKEMEEEINTKKMLDITTKAAYRSFLEDQIKSSLELKKAEAAQQLLEYNRNMEEEEKFNTRMLELMKREFKSEQTHPFKKAFHTGSLKEQCCCPVVPEYSYSKY